MIKKTIIFFPRNSVSAQKLFFYIHDIAEKKFVYRNLLFHFQDNIFFQGIYVRPSFLPILNKVYSFNLHNVTVINNSISILFCEKKFICAYKEFILSPGNFIFPWPVVHWHLNFAVSSNFRRNLKKKEKKRKLCKFTWN